MTRADPQFNLRLPRALRNQIEDAAAKSGRSITAEIVYRLEQSFKEGEGRDVVAQLVARLEAVDPAFAATRKQATVMSEEFGRKKGEGAKVRKKSGRKRG